MDNNGKFYDLGRGERIPYNKIVKGGGIVVTGLYPVNAFTMPKGIDPKEFFQKRRRK